MNTLTRMAQDDCMIYECIINLLSVEGKVKLNAHEKYYMVNYIPLGLCLFKVLFLSLSLSLSPNLTSMHFYCAQYPGIGLLT